jgi:hypothetical protein
MNDTVISTWPGGANANIVNDQSTIQLFPGSSPVFS